MRKFISKKFFYFFALINLWAGVVHGIQGIQCEKVVSQDFEKKFEDLAYLQVAGYSTGQGESKKYFCNNFPIKSIQTGDLRLEMNPGVSQLEQQKVELFLNNLKKARSQSGPELSMIKQQLMKCSSSEIFSKILKVEKRDGSLVDIRNTESRVLDALVVKKLNIASLDHASNKVEFCSRAKGVYDRIVAMESPSIAMQPTGEPKEPKKSQLPRGDIPSVADIKAQPNLLSTDVPPGRFTWSEASSSPWTLKSPFLFSPQSQISEGSLFESRSPYSLGGGLFDPPSLYRFDYWLFNEKSTPASQGQKGIDGK